MYSDESSKNRTEINSKLMMSHKYNQEEIKMHNTG
jgi:hypothetical protein